MSEEEKDLQAKSTVTSQTSSYRSILKATSLFGGVQLYQILIGVISSKFVAVLLGPFGVGVKGLLQSSISMVEGFTSLGISRSAVRDVSVANGTNDQHKIGKTIAALRRFVWVTGLFGMVATVVLSPILSKTAFGNYDYTISFILLSIILLLNQLSAGQMVLLQGLRKLKYLAEASVLGVTLGLVVSIPFYYWFGVKGIVPTLIINSITTLALSYYFCNKVKIENVKISNKEAFFEGRMMMKMGVVMSVSSVLSLLFAYLLRGFIRYQGDIESVGLFTAGFAIINTYVGMIFDAMIKDFYPRLSAVSSDNEKCCELVNQQAEVGTLIMSPLLVACLVFMPLIIRILYSDKFIGAMGYIYWAIPGMFFKLASWAIALIFVSKGASKLYMTNEVVGNLVNFICSIIGYYTWGMMGLGIGFSLGYILYFIKVWWTAHREYSFVVAKTYMQLFVVQILIVLSCLCFILLFDNYIKYILGSVLLIVSAYLSLKGLNRRMGLLALIKEMKENGRK